VVKLGLCGENSHEEIDRQSWQWSISFGFGVKFWRFDAGSTFNKVRLRGPGIKKQS
jgi:hypothetical protein